MVTRQPGARSGSAEEIDGSAPPGAGSGGAPWVRAVTLVGAVLALLLLGAAGGMLVGLPGAGGSAAPSAESVDVGFAQDMTIHHRQATTMATLYRVNGEDPSISQLAFDIDTNQREQIGWMQGWLNIWDRSLTPVDGYMNWMTGPEGHQHHGSVPQDENGAPAIMPGMASEEELAELRAARGEELDILFLQLMLRHHEGGVEMATYAAEHAGRPQVRNLAANMLEHQTSESAKMIGMLRERGAEPLPFDN